MLVEKESQSLIKQLINDKKIIKPEVGRAQYFLSKSRISEKYLHMKWERLQKSIKRTHRCNGLKNFMMK